jgi:large subunit ribosomal protein L19
MDLKKMYQEEKIHSRKIKEFNPGDTVRVHIKIKEGEKERIQVFEGIVISKRNRQLDSSFTVRKMSYGVGVERIFSLYSPSIDKIEVVSAGKVRRAKLYYIRGIDNKKGKVVKEATKEEA